MALTRYDEVRTFFDQRADTWNETVDAAKIRAMLSAAGIECGAAVLDVGSGTGVLIPFLLDAVGPKGRVCALDISPAMLKRAQAKGFSGVQYVCAPVEKMPFSDGCFDTVMCFNAFPHFVDKAAAVGEMARVLVRGGHLVVAHLQSRAALNEYHSHLSGTVSHDFLPDDTAMTSLMESSCLVGSTIVDSASGYILRATKPSRP